MGARASGPTLLREKRARTRWRRGAWIWTTRLCMVGGVVGMLWWCWCGGRKRGPATTTRTTTRSPVTSLATPPPSVPSPAYLHFNVCNGFANQRLAIITAALLANASNRTLVIPRLGIDGEQLDSLRKRTPQRESAADFAVFYDLDAFNATLLAHGVRSSVDSDTLHRSLGSNARHVSAGVFSKHPPRFAEVQHVHVGCPVLAVSAQFMMEHESMFWSVSLDGLVPSLAVRRALEQQRCRHAAVGNDDAGAAAAPNVLHLRVENDWINFCAHWNGIKDGVTRDNCIVLDSDLISRRLLALGLSRRVPLYVSAHWPSVGPSIRAGMLRALERAGYNVVVEDACSLGREMCAAVDYYFALSCAQFVGNSVSTFSGLIMLERMHRGKYASYYNGGTLPLAQWLPFYKLAWVLAENDAATDHYNARSIIQWMSGLKAAVETGLQRGELRPFVLVLLTREQARHINQRHATKFQDLKQWMSSRGARLKIVQSSSKCTRQYSSQIDRSKARNWVQALAWMAVTTSGHDWQDLLQHTHALLTSDRVRFVKRLDLYDFGSRLPVEIAVGATCSTGGRTVHAWLANLLAIREGRASSRIGSGGSSSGGLTTGAPENPDEDDDCILLRGLASQQQLQQHLPHDHTELDVSSALTCIQS